MFSESKPYCITLMSGLFLAAGSVLTLIYFRGFNHDELEHIHSAWYVSNGYHPYKDFFQNHNWAYWALMAPIIDLFGDSISTILLLRFFNGIFAFGIIYGTYLVAKDLSDSSMFGVLSVCILLSLDLFIGTAIEIRPDVPQVFFGVLSFWLFLRGLRRMNWKDFLLSGLMLGLSFVFLQKAIFLVGGMSILMLTRLFKKSTSIVHGITFFSVALIPVLLSLIYLLNHDLLNDYVITNVQVNANRLNTFSPFRIIKRAFLENSVLYTLIVISNWYFALKRGTEKELRYIAFINIFLFVSLFLNQRPHSQNFLQLLPFSAILVTQLIANSWRKSGRPLSLITVIILIFSLYELSINLWGLKKKNNLKKLELIDFVLINSTEEDHIYDGNIQFNVFRKDVHYFWYSVNRGKLLDSYNLVSEGKFSDYNILEIIELEKPRFISNFAIGPNSRLLEGDYSPTKYKKLYQRN